MTAGGCKAKAAQWIRITVRGEAVETAAMLKSRNTIHVEGRLSLDKWRSKNGSETYGLNVVASKIERTLRPRTALSQRDPAGKLI